MSSIKARRCILYPHEILAKHILLKTATFYYHHKAKSVIDLEYYASLRIRHRQNVIFELLNRGTRRNCRKYTLPVRVQRFSQVLCAIWNVISEYRAKPTSRRNALSLDTNQKTTLGSLFAAKSSLFHSNDI